MRAALGGSVGRGMHVVTGLHATLDTLDTHAIGPLGQVGSQGSAGTVALQHHYDHSRLIIFILITHSHGVIIARRWEIKVQHLVTNAFANERVVCDMYILT